MVRYLNTGEARRFYDRFGTRLDTRAFYEDPALEVLTGAARFDQAVSVLEFGCGTGRFAERLLGGLLPPDARYAGCDISETMVRLARERLAPFGGQAMIWQSDGGFDFSPARPPFDRIVATYVLDLLPPAEICLFLAAAAEALRPGGLLGVVSLGWGETPPSRLLSRAWTVLHHFRPGLVGGCRPLHLAQYFDPVAWRLRHRSISTRYAVASEIIVAAPTRK
jgi:cyclopropane fatty-acyl-phospholipid synthase-like methyltransferase